MLSFAGKGEHALIPEADNVADSEDSEDEWDYYRVDNKVPAVEKVEDAEVKENVDNDLQSEAAAFETDKLVTEEKDSSWELIDQVVSDSSLEFQIIFKFCRNIFKKYYNLYSSFPGKLQQRSTAERGRDQG